MNTVLTLIIAETNPLRDALHVLLQTLNHIGKIQFWDHEQLCFSTPLGHDPHLIIWDWSYPPRLAQTMFSQVRARWPMVQILALVEDDRQGQAATIAGADVVLTKGASAAKLLATVSALLDSPLPLASFPGNSKVAAA
jgi:DNA-binding response OmpR family regulator